MPLKSSQGLSVSACTCLRRRKEAVRLVAGQMSPGDTEIGGRISDGVQSQATHVESTQGTTADHVYVRHTSVFQQTCLHCGFAHAEHLSYKLLEMQKTS